ncbi:MAG: calcium/sodium antiporter [Clostridia bacterium]|nr:calcium/sodium antiporter [Clostridia bacterium]
MELFLTILLFTVGLIMIIKGGDFFVDAASWIAEISGIPKLIVGATVVSFATTLPELLVSTIAAVQGRQLADPAKVDMAIGNAVGSVTANIGLIMALALLFMPSVIRRKDYMLKSLLMLGATAVLAAVSLSGSLSIAPSVLLILIFAVAMTENVVSAVRTMSAQRECGAVEERPTADRKTVIVMIVKFLLGVVGIVWGADLLVEEGSALASLIGIPEGIVAVTVIAVGTSLPELVTTLTAIAKKQADLSAGNIIGANIIDLTLILPINMLAFGDNLPFSAQASHLDLPVCLLVGLIATVPMMISSKFRRWQGVALLTVYLAYVAISCLGVLA